ncbi:hypothetical protein ACLIKE_08760 [Ferroplasma acidiphilum]|uniref:Uncharacterized protein n=1 Tax=Ferroplasma acidiphilum TaxID=74969 RepID=A0A7K4FMC9_9ARCH|nr:hypothetical protein [Ferroplasma acidiphilum]NOL60173.1 hypothetical protein [Ferroplasma acidiphilum]WMT53258.1 MAG: hypothetical protein RE473_00040 [Ferroplasma acidiphilum]
MIGMNGERYFYYLKLINNPPDNSVVEYYVDLSAQLENDYELSVSQITELESLIGNYIKMKANPHIKVINAVTGIEEDPPRTKIDDFGGNAVFIGKEIRHGIEWDVYEPRASNNLFFKKWYYNERIASILDKTLEKAIPHRIPNYFDIPPWIFGNFSYRGIRYVPLAEIINNAIDLEIIPNKYYLVQKGISREFIDNINDSNMWL